MLSRYLPILEWGRRYNTTTLSSDLLAAVVVTVMLIPQSLAYALLAGLPPQVGLYASIAPLLVYGLFGSSRVMAVGPVAVVSLMTATAIGEIATQGSPEYMAAALTLGLLSGIMLLAMGLLRLGFLASLLSHPVISGFITASGILIAASQFQHIFGIPAAGHNLYEISQNLLAHVGQFNATSLLIGGAAIAFLFWARQSLQSWLISRKLPASVANPLAKSGPIAVVVITTLLAWQLELDQRGLALVGHVPQGLPPLTLPVFDVSLMQELVLSALLISVIGFVESVSVAQTLAAKKRQRIDPDQELIGLGSANIAAAMSGGYPVTGGFARSVVNFDAGAETPAAGMFTAIGITLTALFLTPLLFYLPKATLAATIIVAVLSLIDLRALQRTWQYSRSDFIAMAATILLTLTVGIEIGIATGILFSIALFLFRTSRPHYAVVGQVPGTEHFRNIDRHNVVTTPTVFSLRVDESLYFPNARTLEERIYTSIATDKRICHVVLMCSAVNFIDSSALESLEAINESLKTSGVMFHLSEVKGPVMDRLLRSHFLDELTGEVFLTQYDALSQLAPELSLATANAPRTLIV